MGLEEGWAPKDIKVPTPVLAGISKGSKLAPSSRHACGDDPNIQIKLGRVK